MTAEAPRGARSQQPDARDPTRWKLCAGLLLPTATILAYLIQSGMPFCCDAAGYLEAIEGHRSEGLYYAHRTLGYRAYFFPYLFSFFPLDLAAPAFGSVPRYALASSALLLISEFAVLLRLWRQPLFWPVYLAVFANPLVLVYVPYPMQESMIAIAFAALVPWLLVGDYRSNRWQFAGLLGLFFGVMYMIRPSHLTLAVPVVILLVGHLRAVPGIRARVLSLLAFAGFAVVVVVPQSLTVFHHRGVIVPYPKTNVLAAQIYDAPAYAKYATNVSGRRNIIPPMPYWSPLSCESRSIANPTRARVFACSKYSDTRRDGVAAILFTGLIHIFSALNYDVLEPYISVIDLPLFSFSQLLSMSIVFLGGYAFIRRWAAGAADFNDWFLAGIVGVSLAVTTITAVETRFGLLATASLSLLAANMLFNGKIDAREWLPIGFGLCAFVGTASLLSVYALALTGATSP